MAGTSNGKSLKEIIRLGRARKVLSQFADEVIKNQQASNYYRIFTTVLSIIIVGHIGACVMHFLGNYEAFYHNRGWMVADDLL